MGWGKKKAPKEREPLGYFGDINEHQQGILDEFKKYNAEKGGSGNPWFDDAYLLKFCRARKFVLKDIIVMWDNFLAWRIKFGVDTILQDFKFEEEEKVMAAYQRAYFGTDKVGRPFYVDKSSCINVPGILKETSLDRMWLRYIHSFEELLKLRFLATSITH